MTEDNRSWLAARENWLRVKRLADLDSFDAPDEALLDANEELIAAMIHAAFESNRRNNTND